jgi:threonine synthase
VPQAYPSLTVDELAQMRTLSYPALAYNIISRFVDDIPADDLRNIINKTYRKEVFGSADITPLVNLTPGLHLLQCSNGPTLAFKDVAMQWLGHLFEYVLARRDLRRYRLGGGTRDEIEAGGAGVYVVAEGQDVSLPNGTDVLHSRYQHP